MTQSLATQIRLLMTIEFFSQRLLNPFRGITCTIRYKSAEAVTTNGRHWDIYVRNELMLDDIDQEQRHKVLTNDIRYGSWSAEHGLKRGPIYPSNDFKILERYGDIVFSALLTHHREAPFPLIDNHEFWLLDEALQPLALLDSVIDPREMDSDQPLQWRPGMRCQETFRSGAVCRCTDAGSTASAAEALAGHISSRSGQQPKAQWFHRAKDGSGVGLEGVGLEVSMAARQLGADAFPRFHLQRSETHGKLIEDFEHWCAPWLLLLPDLDEAQRRLLEPLACRQVDAIDEHFHLYPVIMDHKLFNTARVQAQLRRTNKATASASYPDIHLTGSE